jgi:Flp pilus assembly protein TadD
MSDPTRHPALRTARLLLPLALSFACALGGCSHPAGDAAGTGGARLRSQALIDSGNASFRRGDYAEAAKRYSSASTVDSTDPAAFYGLGMALAKLGRDDDMRAAYSRARILAGRQADTTIHLH